MPPGSSQPFDLFLHKEYNLVEDAITKLFNRCLATSGFPQQAAVTAPSASFSDIGKNPIRPRDEETARKYGFGRPIPAQPPKIIWNDPAYDSAADSCEVDARKPLGDLRKLEDLRYQYTNLGNQLQNELGGQTESLVEDVNDGLTDCLARQGYRSAAEKGSKSEQFAAQFGIKLGHHDDGELARTEKPKGLPSHAQFHPGKGQQEYIPTPEESAFAVAFVKCAKETGLLKKIDRELESIQQEIVEDHAAEFAELNPKLQAMAKKAAEALGK